MRKRYTAQFKSGVVQETLKEEKTIGQIASEEGIHPNQLYPKKGHFRALTNPSTL